MNDCCHVVPPSPDDALRAGRGVRARDGLTVPASQRRVATAALTRREGEVADLARRGYTVAEIAAELHISRETAKSHVDAIRRKLGVRRKSELVRALSVR